MSSNPVSADKKRVMITLPRDLEAQHSAKCKELGLTKSGYVALALNSLLNGEENVLQKK